MRIFSRRIRGFLLFVFVVVDIWAIGLVLFVNSIPKEQNETSVKVDAAIVLTGGSKRVEHGFLRVAQGRARQVFISGVGDSTTPAGLVKQASKLVEALTDDRVTLGYDARSTIGNAQEVGDWVEKHNVKSIRLITANYHMPRSMNEISFALPKSVKIIPDPVFPGGFDISAWLKDDNSRHLVMSEYHKLIASYVRHILIRLKLIDPNDPYLQ